MERDVSLGPASMFSDLLTRTAKVEFVSDQNQMLKILTASKENSTAIAVNAKRFGTATLITCVADILLDDEVVISFKPYDASGAMLPTTTIPLAEIESVLPLSSKFENPFLKKSKFHNNHND